MREFMGWVVGFTDASADRLYAEDGTRVFEVMAKVWLATLLPLLTGDWLSTAHVLPARPTWSCLEPCLARPHRGHTTGCWLLPDERSSRQLLEEVVQEGFILALPLSTGGWVMCHQLASLNVAIKSHGCYRSNLASASVPEPTQ